LVSKDSILSINNLELKGLGVSKKLLSFQGAWDGKHTVAFKCILGKSFGVISQSLLIVSKLVTCNPNILTFGMSFSFGKGRVNKYRSVCNYYRSFFHGTLHM
jgi:hypothetical protein